MINKEVKDYVDTEIKLKYFTFTFGENTNGGKNMVNDIIYVFLKNLTQNRLGLEILLDICYMYSKII